MVRASGLASLGCGKEGLLGGRDPMQPVERWHLIGPTAEKAFRQRQTEASLAYLQRLQHIALVVTGVDDLCSSRLEDLRTEDEFEVHYFHDAEEGFFPGSSNARYQVFVQPKGGTSGWYVLCPLQHLLNSGWQINGEVKCHDGRLHSLIMSGSPLETLSIPRKVAASRTRKQPEAADY